MTHLLKLARANEHVLELGALVTQFFATEPYRFISEYDPPSFGQGDTVRFTLYLHAREEPPPRLALLAGDCLFNLRASLDHLVFSIAQKYAGRAVEENTSLQFVMYEDVQQFKSWEGRVRQHLPPGALAIIERLQPYAAWRLQPQPPTEFFLERDLLWLLDALAIADKHQTLAMVTQVRVVLSNLRVENGKFLDLPLETFSFTRSVEHGDKVEILSIPFVAESEHAKVTAASSDTSDVAFSDERWPARGKMVRGVLEMLRDHVQHVVFPALEPFL